MFLTAAIQTHLYDVILWVAGIETPREGEFDDVIALYVAESVAVLLSVYDQAAVRVCPSVLQWWRSVRMAVQITGGCAVPSPSTSHTTHSTHCAQRAHLLACITLTLKAPSVIHVTLSDTATRFGARRRHLQGVSSQLSTCLKLPEVLKS